MNVLEKIKRSWWVIFSFIFIFNGLGFVYIGFRQNNHNWTLEGIIYEIPWIFAIIYSSSKSLLYGYVALAEVLMIVSIIRSIWIAIKLNDVYENEEKYTIQSTNLNSQTNAHTNNSSSSTFTCCLCLICIFIAFAIVSIL